MIPLCMQLCVSISAHIDRIDRIYRIWDLHVDVLYVDVFKFDANELYFEMKGRKGEVSRAKDFAAFCTS